VIIAVYNQEAYIRRAIDSILSQTLSDLELILIDDGSGPAAAAIADDYAARDGRVVAEHKVNGGVSSALNRGLMLARAPYVARLDGDDIAAPDRLERQAAFMDAHPDIGIVGGQMTLIDAEDRKLKRLGYMTGAHKLAARAMSESVMASSAMLIRRDLLVELGGWRSALDSVEDYDLLLRAVEKNGLDNLPDVVLYYRVHEQQVSQRHWHRMCGLTEVAREAAKIRRAGGIDPIDPNSRVTPDTLRLFALAPDERERLAALLENQPLEPVLSENSAA
jgi:glycosyltransferase involved in cell wall biosynthesis